MSEEITELIIIGIKGDLPDTQQIKNYTCVPHCLWMVLEKIKENIPNNRLPNYTPDDIAKIVKSKPYLSTSYEDIKFLNEELKNYSPIIEFKPDSGFKWGDILKELKEGRPVIAYLKGNPLHRVAHAVVITNYDKKLDQVTYKDPMHGKKTIYITDFMNYWDNAANVLYPVEVGRLIQTYLDESIKGGDKNE